MKVGACCPCGASGEQIAGADRWSALTPGLDPGMEVTRT